MLNRATTAAAVMTCLALAGCKPRQAPPAQKSAASTPAATGQQKTLEQLAAKMKMPAPASPWATLAPKLVELSLHCVEREYPNKPSDVQASDESVKPPRKLHPAFYGCFDWHSAVHGHWTMVRLLKRQPSMAAAVRIRAALNRRLTTDNLAGELAYFKEKHHRLFERPYGWGWLLRLQAELLTFDDADARRWSAALKPLARLLAERTVGYLERLSVPVRAGTHASTAFALAHIYDYARVAGDRSLGRAVAAAARRFYIDDIGCPVDYEPSGEDFVSPCFAEADVMRRVLPPARFRVWLARFLPPMGSTRFAGLLRPPEVRDKEDPRIGHLIGLSLQRAWTMEGVASGLAKTDPRRKILRVAAAVHREDALAKVFHSGYGGAHWLASFAVFLLTGADTEVRHPPSWDDPVTGTPRGLPSKEKNP